MSSKIMVWHEQGDHRRNSTAWLTVANGSILVLAIAGLTTTDGGEQDHQGYIPLVPREERTAFLAADSASSRAVTSRCTRGGTAMRTTSVSAQKAKLGPLRSDRRMGRGTAGAGRRTDTSSYLFKAGRSLSIALSWSRNSGARSDAMRQFITKTASGTITAPRIWSSGSPTNRQASGSMIFCLGQRRSSRDTASSNTGWTAK